MIGKNIKYYRLMRGISQEALAQQIGLNKMAVSNYEMGKRTPDLATIRKIADALQVTIGKLWLRVKIAAYRWTNVLLRSTKHRPCHMGARRRWKILCFPAMPAI